MKIAVKAAIVLSIVVGSATSTDAFLHPSAALATASTTVVSRKKIRASTTATKSDNDDEDDVGSTLASASFNLIKGAVGSGVLSLPAGVAAYGDVRKALLPTTSILLLLGTISAYTFHLLGRLTAIVNDERLKKTKDDSSSSDICSDVSSITSIGQLWDHEVGTSSSWLISLVVLITCYGTCLAYSITLGDTFKSLAETAGLSGLLCTRQFNVAAISLLGVYPMARLKSLEALAPVSISGVVGILVTCIVMALRAMPGGVYSAATTTAGRTTNYLASLAPDLTPSFGVTGLRGPKSLLVISSMLATAFLVHMSSPEFYQTLKNKSPTRFAKLSAIGFAGTAGISALMMILGFLTFGGNSKGMILNNYSTLDSGATICRLLMGVSLLGSYGFLSNAIRNAYYQISYKGKEKITDAIHYRTSRLLVGSVTALALLTNDAGFVVSVNGAVLGSALIYIIPAFLFLKSTERRVAEGALKVSSLLRFEQWWNRGLISLGTFLALAGAWMSVVNSFFPHLL
jgi:sodium-coupled neutral amino acid transporter 11